MGTLGLNIPVGHADDRPPRQADGWIAHEGIRGDSCKFVVGGKQLPSDARSEVFFLDALRRLREHRLVKLRQNIPFRRAWQLTARGYDVADLLRKHDNDKQEDT